AQTQLQFDIEPRFEPRTCRHLVGDRTYVLHCHHYATLYTQLAEDCGMLDGKKLLAESAEDTFYQILCDFFAAQEPLSIDQRFAIGERFFSVTGMGTLSVRSAGPECGEVVLPTAHLDAGWIKKWGKSDRPVNHIARGFIAALFAAAFARPSRTYTVTETASIAAGAPESRFVVVTE
ncbi:MAG: hypothetical protein WBD46_08115, partial [Acidobacteriaceae bacterium]